MSRAMVPQIASYVHTRGWQVGDLAVFAPGVVGVHETCRQGSEWNVYFELTQWRTRNPGVWGDRGTIIADPAMHGIGLLEGDRMGGIDCFPAKLLFEGRVLGQPAGFDVLIRYARGILTPAAGGAGWLDAPKVLSEPEIGGVGFALGKYY